MRTYYAENKKFEVKLKPYRILNDSNRQNLLATMYNNAFKNKKYITVEDGVSCANFNSKDFNFFAQYDARAHKYNCYVTFKKHIFNIGLIPSKTDSRFFNADTIKLLTRSGKRINDYVTDFKIKKIGDRFESYLSVQTHLKYD